MTYIKINETYYPAVVYGAITDNSWDNRASKTIKLKMNYDTAINLFNDGISWSIAEDRTRTYSTVNENNEIETKTEEYKEEYDNSAYNIAGPITDHRDGYLSIKMGKPTELEEAYELLYGEV